MVGAEYYSAHSLLLQGLNIVQPLPYSPISLFTYILIPSSAYHKKFQLDYNKIVQSFYSSRSCSTQQPSIYIDASLYCFYYKETILMFNILHFVFKENTEGLF